MLRHLRFLSVLLAVSGCTIPTGPPYQVQNPDNNDLYWGSLATPILPLGHYDGIFSSSCSFVDRVDSTGSDTQSIDYFSQALLYNIFADEVIGSLPGLSATLNGNSLSWNFSEFDTILDLDFPTPVTWGFSGDTHFPSFTHTVSSEKVPQILTPAVTDSLYLYSSFQITYSAPGTDSVSVQLFYSGNGVYASDTTNTTQAIFFSMLPVLVTNGYYNVPAYTSDTSLFKSFTPRTIDVFVEWGRGDTIHDEGKTYGFLTTVGYERILNFKQ
jgi:hypothetical protein